MSRKENILSSAVLLVVSGAGFIYSWLQIKPTNLIIHPFTFPTIILGLLVFLSFLRLMLGLRQPKDDGKVEAWHISKKTVLTIVLVSLYAVAFKPVGYILSTFIYLMLQMLLLREGKRNYILMLIIALAGSFGIYLVFYHLFDIFLPTGLMSFM